MSFQERIHSIMSHYNLSAKDLAAITGVQRSAISHLINGRNKPSVAFITQLTAHFKDLNVQWLLHGKGDLVTNVTNEVRSEEKLNKPKPVTSVNKSEQQAHSHDTLVTNHLQKEDQVIASSKSFAAKTDSIHKRVTKIICVYSDGSTSEYVP